jgi:hypothetical protein
MMVAARKRAAKHAARLRRFQMSDARLDPPMPTRLRADHEQAQ